MREKKEKGLRNFLAGAIAGAGDTCVTMPLDTIKTQMQLNKNMQGAGVVSCSKRIIGHDGFTGFYKGFQPFVIQASGKAAIRFMTFGLLCDVMDNVAGKDFRKNNPTVGSLLCGLGAGTCEALFWTSPTERIKVMGQKQAGTGRAAVGVREIIAKEGISGLYVGAAPTALRQATSVATRFTLVDKVKTLVANASGTDPRNQPFYVTFLAGGIGGAVSVMLNNPIDVVKSKIQGGYKGGVIPCIRDLLKERGFRAFGAGLSARVPRLFLSQAIQFAVVDTILKII
eukprot:g2511.t1